MITDEFASIPKRIHDYGFKRLLLAVSGGLDSICLAHYFIANREALGIEWLGIAHVHHGLRVGTADRDAAFVEAFAKAHGVPFFLKRLNGEALKAAEGSLEENARDARYKALVEIALDPSPRKGDHGSLRAEAQVTKETPLHSAQDDTLHTAHPTSHTPHLKGSEATDPIPHTPHLKAAEGCDLTPHPSFVIVTAHHAGDQAETMYMRLRRGTTLAGLRGIQEVRVLNNSQGVAGGQHLGACSLVRMATKVGLANEAPLKGVMEDHAAGCNQGGTSPTQDDKNSLDPIGASPLQDDKAKKNFLPPTSYFLLKIFRPFLSVSREDLLAYARENNLEWCEDESNADVKFARNKVRHVYLPQLARGYCDAATQLCRIASLADKAYAKVMDKCNELFNPIVSLEKEMPELVGHDKSLDPAPSNLTQLRQQIAKFRISTPRCSAQDDTSLTTRPSSLISLNKKALRKILLSHADADLSELFRLWLSELGFRFPIGFFYSQTEPAHVKIPIRAAYRKRSIVKKGSTVLICEFEDVQTASKFVSCGMKE